MVYAILTAAGRGTRMLSEVPKQFLNVYDKPIIAYTLQAFQRHPAIDGIVVACLEGWGQILRAYAAEFGITKLLDVIPGGETGQESIRNGLDWLNAHDANDPIVLIHDGNRPMVSEDVISDCIANVRLHGSAIPVVPCNEAMLSTEDGEYAFESIPREKLFKTQTPHGFPLKALLDAHERAKQRGITGSVASCTLMLELGERVHFSKGSDKNFKITTPEDIEIFKALLAVQHG